MKITYRELGNGQYFTWWEGEKHHIGIKIGEQAIRLSDNTFVRIHANTKVSSPETIPEDVIVKFGRNGAAYLVTPYSAETVCARRVIVVTTEIMHKASFAPRKIGGREGNAHQVYITLDLLEKRIRDLDTLARMVKLLIQTDLSVGSSDNEIMSTSQSESQTSLE